MVEVEQVSIDSNYVNVLQKYFPSITFKRIQRNERKYVTNTINKSLNNDSTIFRETQVKRILNSYLAPFVGKVIKEKLSYFSQRENRFDNQIYKFDKAQDLKAEEKYAMQNIGHATLLIQTPGFNILTDPVFSHLSWLLYPAKTISHPAIEKLPQINIILISHNHRDHLDKDSLQMLLQHYKKMCFQQPLVFVPMGDKNLLKSFGFQYVEEVEWFTKITIANGTNKINLISIPADHRSGRNLIDHHMSLVVGWVINPEQDEVIFKYSGDTRPLTCENQKATDAVLWKEIEHKIKIDGKTLLPDIVCFEPSGPNYTRQDMDITHQSTSYSVLLKFIEAINLAKLSSMNFLDLLSKFQSVMMHHNKFELGPDRFNEGLFVFKKLFLYINLSTVELREEYSRQKQKLETSLDWQTLRKCTSFTSRPTLSILGAHTSLLIHAKDFIIQDIELVSQMMEEFHVENAKDCIKEYIVSNTTFPKIGERLNHRKLKESSCDVNSIQKYNKKIP